MPGESSEYPTTEVEGISNISREQLVLFTDNFNKSIKKISEPIEGSPRFDYSKLPNDRLNQKIIPSLWNSREETYRQFGVTLKRKTPFLDRIIPSLRPDTSEEQFGEKIQYDRNAEIHLFQNKSMDPEVNPLKATENIKISDKSLADIGKIIGKTIALVELSKRKTKDIDPNAGDILIERKRLQDIAPNSLRVLDTLIQEFRK